LLPFISNLPKINRIAFPLNNSFHINQLKDHFQGRKSFSNQDLLSFYKQFDENLSSSTLNWRIYNLVHSGQLKRLGRATFAVGENKTFDPSIDKHLKKQYTRIKKEFPFLECCIWDTRWISSWMLHQPFVFYTIIEVEKDAAEAVFHYLQNHNQQVFLQPNAELLQRYASNRQEIIIIKSLVTESPVQIVDNVATITVEKLIVDLFVDTDIFFAYQGGELSFIFNNLLNNFTINNNKLLRYADRRRKKESLVKFLDTKN
jgi:hypothetical protein